jgi:tetratricopeptide (TPR) repeat protein
MRPICLLLLATYSSLGGDCPGVKLSPDETAVRLRELQAEAWSAVERGQFSVAAQHYREAICLDPKDPRLHYSLGVAEAAAQNLQAARQALETADALRPDSTLALKMLAKVSVAIGEMDDVKQLLRSAAERFPQDGQLHAELARALTDQKLLDLAIAEWLRAERGGELDADSVITLAALESMQGAYADSIRHALTVENQQSLPAATRGAAAFVAGRSYTSLDQREQAIQHLKRAIQFAPMREDSYLALALALEKAEQFDVAAKVLEQRQKNIPDAKPMLLPLGSDLVWAGQYKAGARVLKELIQKSPDEFDGYWRLAFAYGRLGQPDLQVAVLQELNRRKPDYPMVHIAMVTALMDVSSVDYPRVLRELAEAQKLTPDDPDIYYLRGKVYVAAERYEEAVAELCHSIELRPLETTPYYLLGLTYRRLGRNELAKEVLERMKHLKPTPGGPSR